MIRITALLTAAITSLYLAACGAQESRASTTNNRFEAEVSMLREAGFTLTDPVAELSAECVKTLEQLNDAGVTSKPLVLDVMGLQIIVTDHVEMSGPAAYADYPRVFLLIDKVAIVPVDGKFSIWQDMVSAVNARGGRYVERDRKKLTDVYYTLRNIRRQIEHHKHWPGSVPDFSKQWQDLVAVGSLLDEAPRNPLASRSVATSIIIVNTPGQTGESVSLKSAGWVWNSADAQMYPAGWTEEQLEREIDRMDQPRFTDRRRVQIKGILGGCRAAVASPQNIYPTLEAINSGKVIKGSPNRLVNPFNGSGTFQAAKWNPIDPPVSGTAGWNYDPKTGKIWANTNVTGENEF